MTSRICRRLYGNLYAYTARDFTLSAGEWEERRQAALDLVELSSRLDKHELSFCDIKGDNFGWHKNGKAVLLDVDSLFTKKEISDNLKVKQITSCIKGMRQHSIDLYIMTRLLWIQ